MSLYSAAKPFQKTFTELRPIVWCVMFLLFDVYTHASQFLLSSSFLLLSLCCNDLLLRFLTLLKQIIGEDKQLRCEPKTEGDICYLTKQMKSLRQIYTQTHTPSVIQTLKGPSEYTARGVLWFQFWPSAVYIIRNPEL